MENISKNEPLFALCTSKIVKVSLDEFGESLYGETIRGGRY